MMNEDEVVALREGCSVRTLFAELRKRDVINSCRYGELTFLEHDLDNSHLVFIAKINGGIRMMDFSPEGVVGDSFGCMYDFLGKPDKDRLLKEKQPGYRLCKDLLN